MTRMKFKFKIPYGAISETPFQTNTRLSLKAISEAPFQTNTRLSLKKKKEERNTIPYKRKQPFIHGTKETKKKKKSKTLKPKTSFPIKIHTRSAYRFFFVPSNT